MGKQKPLKAAKINRETNRKFGSRPIEGTNRFAAESGLCFDSRGKKISRFGRRFVPRRVTVGRLRD